MPLLHSEVIQFLQENCCRKDGKLLARTAAWWATDSREQYFQYITDYTSSLLSTATFAQRVWHIRRSTPSQPKCKHQQCNSFAPWDPQASNYQIYCSKKCSVSDPAKVEVYRKTTAEKYGGHPMQNDEVLAARKQSALTRYGVDSYSKTSEFKKKVKETCIARYGVSNPMKTTEVKETLKISNISKYGVEYPLQHAAVLLKQTNTNLSRYGGPSPMNSETVKQLHVTNMLANHGVTNIKHLLVSPDALLILQDAIKLAELVSKHGRAGAARELNVDLTTIGNYIWRHNLEDQFNTESGLETQIRHLLEKHNISFIQRTRKIIPPQELDFFLPEYNIAIECNGVYWHSTERQSDKNYHFNKWKACSERGIILLSYFENEIYERFSVIESKILYLTKRLTPIRVGARKVSISSIGIEEERAFLNLNHIQGFLQSRQVSLGAYYNSELLGVMCASVKTSGELEISRFAVATQYIVPGLFSKLLSSLVKKLQFVGVVFSFSDNCHGNGNLYRSAGFVVDKIQPPVYYYVNIARGEKENRQRYMKSKIKKRFKLEIESKTESQLMKELKYFKIWDAGKIRWIKRIE